MDERQAKVKGYVPNKRQSKTEAPPSRNSLTDGGFFPEVRGAQTYAGDAASPATFESRLQESLDSPSPVRKPRRRKRRGRRRPERDDDDLDVPFASAYEPAPPGDDEAQLMAMSLEKEKEEAEAKKKKEKLLRETFEPTLGTLRSTKNDDGIVVEHVQYR